MAIANTPTSTRLCHHRALANTIDTVIIITTAATTCCRTTIRPIVITIIIHPNIALAMTIAVVATT